MTEQPERLVDLVATQTQHDEVKRRAELHAALARAQAKFKPLKRSKTVSVATKTGGRYEFSYAPLETVLDMVRQPLADEGLAITQRLDDTDAHTVLRTEILHAGGGVLESVWPIAARGTPQEFGSALTYLRRYTLVALLGLASEEDDDGNAAAGNTDDDVPAADPNVISKAQRDRLFAIARDSAVSNEQLAEIVKGVTGEASTKTIPKDRYDEIVEGLQAMKVPF